MKIKLCTEINCKNAQTTKNYCRLHYVKNWKKIKEASQKKAADKLNKYVDGICKKHPDRFMENIRKDIRTDAFGDEPVAADEAFGGDIPGDVMESMGYKSEDGLDKLVSQIKIDKDY